MKLRSIIILVFVLTTCNSFSQGTNNWEIGNPFVSRTDAAFSFNEDYSTLISGRKILFEPISNDPSLKSTPNSLSSDLFPNPHSFKPVDAALDLDEESFLLFKGNVFVKVDKSTLKSISRVAQWHGWPGFWRNKIDAALKWENGSYIFIKGLQYVSYDPRTGTTSSPNQLNRLVGWPSTWSGSIDAAFNGKDGYYYFIRKGEILAMDINNLSIAVGYPKKLSGTQTGLITQNTNTLITQNPNSSIAVNNNYKNLNPNVNTEEWCPVGTPDESTSPDGGNISPVTTELAGGTGGEKFSDKLVRGVRVKEVRVWGINTIQAIEIVTVSKEGFITEGGPKGFAFGKPKIFTLVPGECINGIEGTWDGTSGELIHTLRFITNKRKSDWFGSIAGRKGKKEFLFEVPPEGSFSGFYGTSSKRNLISLGIKYNIYQYVVFDENGKLIETTGDKTKWNKGTKSQIASKNKKKDPNDLYIDNHKPADNARDKFLYQKMPQFEWIAQTVDLTKIDPWNITSPTSIASFPESFAIVPVPSPLDGDILRKDSETSWLGPYGMNRSISKGINSGTATDEMKMSKSFSEYSKEFSLKVGAEFNSGGVVGGSAEVGHKQRKTETIGSEKVLMSKKVINQSHIISFDLDWEDPFKGTKYRQALNIAFRRSVAALTVPSGKVPVILSKKLVKNGELPGNIKRHRKIYQEQIIDKFGTHFLNDLMFGGKYIMYNEINKEEITKSRMSETEAKVAFNFGSDNVMKSDGTTIIINNGGSAMDELAKLGTGNSSGSLTAEAKMMNSYKSSKKRLESTMRVVSVGGGGSTKFENWDANVSRSPVVIDYSLIPHTKLLTNVFFPSDKDIDKKRELLDLFIRQYLVDHSIPLNRNPNQSITFPGQGVRKVDDGPLDVNLTLKVEVTSVKTNEDEDWPEDDPLEIRGNAKLEILDEAGTILSTIDGLVSGLSPRLDTNTTRNLSGKTTEFTIKKSKIEKLKLYISGKVYEYDDAGDDIIFNYSNRVDAGAQTIPFENLLNEDIINAVGKVQGDESFMQFGIKISIKNN
ncbi:MAC/perforin domain-containing protein [Winogradskyella vincentii]|uniref:MACPF domain-containing protein n=1 Tax=Winogradskyella vincentii TaxID=2877122 RepID=A0ABS7Y3F1_9FLAO|nr:MAC/perforin domain-containing protein [Winogradskyella vincentii]MCA0154447.1 hypothetical protein [Winogradskyella vincentii]